MKSRLIKLLMILGGGEPYSREHLSDELNTCHRNVTKLIDCLRKAGFSVPRASNGFYQLTTLPDPMKAMSEILYFTDYEAEILSRAIYSIKPDSALKERLLRRLSCILNSPLCPETLSDNKMEQIILKIKTSIKYHKHIIIQNYNRDNIKKHSECLLEVFFINDAATEIYAYEPAGDKIITFLIANIASVRLLETRHMHENKHKMPLVPLFGSDVGGQYYVCLHLDMKAKNILIKDYPLYDEIIVKLKDDVFELRAFLSELEIAGRFVLGLFDHVRIVEGNELKEYVYKKLTCFAACL